MEKFDYGIISYKHRFNINRSLDDYAVTELNKVISCSLVLKYKTIACDKLVYEFQILYRDSNNICQCLCLDLYDYTISVIYKGNMRFSV